MTSTISPHWIRVPVFLGALGLLFAGFHSNRWNVADQRRFETQNRDMEAHVVARMVQSRADGLLSRGALVGIGTIDGSPVDFSDWDHLPVEEQFEAYADGSGFLLYEPYLSQNGAQGTLFSILDRGPGGTAADRLAAYRGLTAALSATALALMVLWFLLEFGLLTALAVLGGILASQWLTVFGNKLFWSLWAFYVPILAVAFFLRARRRFDRRALRYLVLVAGLGMLVKALFNGFEFVSTVAIMALVPVVFYAVRDRWPGRDAVRAAMATLLGVGLALTVSGVLLVGQIALVSGEASAGVRHIARAVERRTHPSELRFPGEEGQDATVGEVVKTYLGAEWSNLSRFVRGSTRLLPAPARSVPYWFLLVAFGAASVLLLAAGSDPTDRALVAATWASLLAPLSWFVVFTSHSAVHTYMDEIVWQMPFVLFGFAILGRLAALAWGRAAERAGLGGDGLAMRAHELGGEQT